ncbi:rRNA methyltransferase 2, mitochondrial [Centruroides vittatus]|uniref:rRNA methyltransferase 2, mitochondrial n=1 Tax=Centruroides vittatus TaxID=120091 RepID=UPI00350F42E9
MLPGSMNAASVLQYRFFYQFIKLSKRNFNLTSLSFKIIPDNLKGKSKSSQEWLTRQLNDVYVKKSRYESYRARSAYKLIEIDDKYKLFKPGMIVIDCGAAPGSWSQVAIKRVTGNNNENHIEGKVIALDIIHVAPIDGVTILQEADFKNPSTQKKIIDILDGSNADIVLSDMAPRASGIKELDVTNIISLAYNVLQFSIRILSVGGSILCKVWDGDGVNDLEMNMKKFFSSVRRTKPPSSRMDSAELFLLGKDFKGVKK